MTDPLSAFSVGQTVKLQDGRVATVRYLGDAHFAAGDWVGVELDSATGKNNGEVHGQRYFDCQPFYGMFVRPAAIRAFGQTPANLNGNGHVQKPLKPTGLTTTKRQSVAGPPGVGTRASLNAASPSVRAAATAAHRPSLSRSPVKSPTKPPYSAAPSVSSTSASPSPGLTARSRPSSTHRTSMGPPALPSTKPTRPSVAGPGARQRASITATSSSTSTVARRTSVRPQPLLGFRKPSVASSAGEGSGQGSDYGTESPVPRTPDSRKLSAEMSPPVMSPVPPRDAARTGERSPSDVDSTRGPPSSTLTQRTIHTLSTTTAGAREIEDLKKKLRMMEKKRKDDRDQLRTLERVQSDRDKFEAIIQKLQSKLQPQHQEMAELRRQLYEANARLDQIGPEQAQHEDALEMATLDREMAEEHAEVLRAEVDALKQRAEELQLEVDLLKAENQELDQGTDPAEKSSHGWLHMEKENARLREALLRLRDLTRQTEADLHDQIKGLEDDVQELGGVKHDFERTREKFLQAEANIEDLRQQLDAALGAETMLEELTQKNMSLSDRIDELTTANQDLEGLKEVNDEIELDHIEYEKQLEREIDHKDTLLRRQEHQAKRQADAIEEFDYTIARYKELVKTLQADLDALRASQQSTETETEEFTQRSRAVMDLNMKLQASARKTQTKTIELELRRLEAQEAADLLEIVQRFLPDAYLQDKDSVAALLRFKRVGFKAHLLHTLVTDRVMGTAPRGHEDDVLAGCEILDRLTWIRAMSRRFVRNISACSVDRFAHFAGTLYELEPVERALNGWIDGLRNDELKEKQCASELQRTLALMSHLAEIHLVDDLENYAEGLVMRGVLTQSHLENAASAFTQIRDMVTAHVVAPEDEDDMSARNFARQVEACASQARSSTVSVGKIVRSLEELRDRSLSLPMDASDAFERCEQSAEEIMRYAVQLGLALFGLVSDEGRTHRPSYDDVHTAVRVTTATILSAEENDVFGKITARLHSLASSLHELNLVATDLPTAIEFERPPAPWLTRAEELKALAAKSADRDDEIRRLKHEIHERATQIALRDQAQEELSVKIELLEARMSDASKHTHQLDELEASIRAGKGREKDLADAMETQVKELEALELERDRYKKLASERAGIGDGVGAGGSPAVTGVSLASVRSMEALTAEIASLQSAVRYLRKETQLLRNKPSSTIEPLLDAPVLPQPTTRQQELRLSRAEQKTVMKELLKQVAPVQMARAFRDGVPDRRPGWKPKSQTLAWQVLGQRDAADVWKRWCDDVLSDGHIGATKLSQRRRSRRTHPPQPLAGVIS
ncbi:MAG: hypothetical protein M1838_000762 [Thelocarpon superellum]|nr:MAG: hypothetical protein M1838_000762 [Thelocarpon superellum]